MAANPDAQRAWDGDDGAYWAANAAVFDASLERYTSAFLDAAALDFSDRVLDVGCGNGQTTLTAARRASRGRALGVDLSADMLAVARRRAVEQSVANVDFVQTDAQVHPFEPAAFDVVISRCGVMFFADAVAAFTNIGRAVRPGGRAALMVWQGIEGNEWLRAFGAALAAGRPQPNLSPDTPGPLSLADPGRVRAVLTVAGFGNVALTAVAEPMSFGSDPASAYEFVRNLPFARFLLRDLDGAARAGAFEALRVTIEAHVTPDGVLFGSAAWLVTAVRD